MVKSINQLISSFLKKENKNSISFIVGTGRCGTTMLAQILNSHSNICVPHELQILFEYSQNGKRLYDFFEIGEAQKWGASEFISHIEQMCPHNFKKFYDYEVFFKRQSYPIIDMKKMINKLYYDIANSYHKSVFIEQTPWYGQRLEVIKELFPNAKIIHILRDGRDVSLSFARTPWWHDDPLENLERWGREITKISKDLKANFKPNNFIEIRYEDFVLNPKETLNDICKFLDVAFEPNMLNPEFLTDYRTFRKGDLNDSISSKEFNQWAGEKQEAVFADNVYGWRKNPEIFGKIMDNDKKTLSNYGYSI
jgi:hypothetical protein